MIFNSAWLVPYFNSFGYGTKEGCKWIITGWWFQIIICYLHPYKGKIPNLTCSYFSKGLVQPPTRSFVRSFHNAWVAPVAFWAQFAQQGLFASCRGPPKHPSADPTVQSQVITFSRPRLTVKHHAGSRATCWREPAAEEGPPFLLKCFKCLGGWVGGNVWIWVTTCIAATKHTKGVCVCVFKHWGGRDGPQSSLYIYIL